MWKAVWQALLAYATKVAHDLLMRVVFDLVQAAETWAAKEGKDGFEKKLRVLNEVQRVVRKNPIFELLDTSADALDPLIESTVRLVDPKAKPGVQPRTRTGQFAAKTE